MSRLLNTFSTLPIIVLATLAFAQNPPASDPKALAYAAQSIAAITGGTSISDVTLTGSVTWNGGADSGTATLVALGSGESRMDLALSAGIRSEIRDAQTGITLGEWIAQQNGVSGRFAFHNCQTDAVWFFPALGSLAGGPNAVFSYIGQETHNGAAVQHIQSYKYQPSQGSGPNLQQLSTMDFYLDATTLLPLAIGFNAHPDGNAASNIPIEVDLSNYQVVGGVVVPMHIQKYLQGTLTIDLTISAAAFNTGVPLSTFSIN